MACQAWIRLGCPFEGNRVSLAVPAMQSVPEIECALLRSIHAKPAIHLLGQTRRRTSIHIPGKSPYAKT